MKKFLEKNQLAYTCIKVGPSIEYKTTVGESIEYITKVCESIVYRTKVGESTVYRTKVGKSIESRTKVDRSIVYRTKVGESIASRTKVVKVLNNIRDERCVCVLGGGDGVSFELTGVLKLFMTRFKQFFRFGSILRHNIKYLHKLSRAMTKPDFCLCENKGADQLRSNCEADQRLCFRYTDSTLPLLLKSEISSF